LILGFFDSSTFMLLPVRCDRRGPLVLLLLIVIHNSGAVQHSLAQ
jgi:hypothetical protein